MVIARNGAWLWANADMYPAMNIPPTRIRTLLRFGLIVAHQMLVDFRALRESRRANILEVVSIDRNFNT
jgi:hypothetical protein